MDLSKYKALFLQEVAEHIGGIEDGLLALDETPGDKATIDNLFRHYHSIKGMSASMGYEAIQKFAHVQEDLLDSARGEGKPNPSPAMISALLECLDGLKALASMVEGDEDLDSFDTAPLIKKLETCNEAGNEAGEAAPTPPPVEPPATTTEAPHDSSPDSSHASSHVATMTGTPPPLAATPPPSPTPAPQETPPVPAAGPTPAAKPPSPRPPTRQTFSEGALKLSNTMKVSGSVFDDLLRVAGDLLTSLSRLRSTDAARKSVEVRDGIHELGKSIEELRGNILDARMLPFSDLTHSLPRIVRDISKKMGKEVDLIIKGGDISLDKSILEKMGDPLVHIIRNAVDHGIEVPGDRVAAGKGSKGRIRVSASTRRDNVIIEIIDDGAGIDTAKLRKHAVSNGIPADSVNAMNDKEALMLICHPGLSLAAEVTNVSGRGVGMDVVKDAIEKLGGSFYISSAFGKGTKFTMELPRAASIMKVLLVKNGDEVFSIPVSKVNMVQEVPGESVRAGTFEYMNETIPLVEFDHIMSIKGKRSAEDTATVVVIDGDSDESGSWAITFDNFIDEIDAYLKPLKPPFTSVWGVSAISTLGDGRPVFSLDMSQLTKRARHMSRSADRAPNLATTDEASPKTN